MALLCKNISPDLQDSGSLLLYSSNTNDNEVPHFLNSCKSWRGGGRFWEQSNKFSRWGLSSHHNSSMKSFRAAFSSTCFPHSVQQSMQFDYWHIWKYARFSESFNLKYLKWLLALKRFHLRQMDLNKWKQFFATARITVQYGKPRFLQRPQAPRQDIICRLSTTLHLSMNWYKPLHEMFVSKSL